MFSYAFTLPFLHATGHRWVDQISYQSDSYMYIHTHLLTNEKRIVLKLLQKNSFLSSFVVIWESMEHNFFKK